MSDYVHLNPARAGLLRVRVVCWLIPGGETAAGNRLSQSRAHRCRRAEAPQVGGGRPGQTPQERPGEAGDSSAAAPGDHIVREVDRASVALGQLEKRHHPSAGRHGSGQARHFDRPVETGLETRIKPCIGLSLFPQTVMGREADDLIWSYKRFYFRRHVCSEIPLAASVHPCGSCAFIRKAGRADFEKRVVLIVNRGFFRNQWLTARNFA